VIDEFLSVSLFLLPSRRASPPFGWYSFYRPTEDRRLRRYVAGHIGLPKKSAAPGPGVQPGHGHPSQY